MKKSMDCYQCDGTGEIESCDTSKGDTCNVKCLGCDGSGVLHEKEE